MHQPHVLYTLVPAACAVREAGGAESQSDPTLNNELLNGAVEQCYGESVEHKRQLLLATGKPCTRAARGGNHFTDTEHTLKHPGAVEYKDELHPPCVAVIPLARECTVKTLELEEAGSLVLLMKISELSWGLERLYCLALELKGPSNCSYSVADALPPDT
jgi:hypothetical protein